MRVRVAESTSLFWDQGRLVWDDYVSHRQHALSVESERVLRWFSDWRGSTGVRLHAGGLVRPNQLPRLASSFSH